MGPLGRSHATARVVQVVGLVEPILARHLALTNRLAERPLDEFGDPPLLADVRAQLRELIRPGFVADAGRSRLPDLDRYLRAAAHRLDKAPANLARDAQALDQVDLVEGRYADLLQSLRPTQRGAAEVAEIGWMIEERCPSSPSPWDGLQRVAAADPQGHRPVLRPDDHEPCHGVGQVAPGAAHGGCDAWGIMGRRAALDPMKRHDERPPVQDLRALPVRDRHVAVRRGHARFGARTCSGRVRRRGTRPAPAHRAPPGDARVSRHRIVRRRPAPRPRGAGRPWSSTVTTGRATRTRACCCTGSSTARGCPSCSSRDRSPTTSGPEWPRPS